jgi:ADP-heptose:LPS heptosyltransferase
VYEHRKDARKHEVEYNLDLLREVGCPPAGRVGRESFPIHISEAARNRVVAMLRESGVRMERRRIIIHPGSGGSAREWPLENFGRLGALLTEDEENEILVTGTESERARVDAVLHALAGRGKGFAGKTGVQELTALIESASLVIAHSTGPLHIAVACGTPVLGLYPQLTPMSPRRWGPYVGRNRVLVPDKPADCTDCAGGSFCPCMASISIGEAFEAAQALLSAAAVSTGSGS